MSENESPSPILPPLPPRPTGPALPPLPPTATPETSAVLPALPTVLSPEAVTQVAKRRKAAGLMVAVLIFLLLGVYVYYPYLCIGNLRKAVREGNAAQMTNHVAFESLVASLNGQIGIHLKFVVDTNLIVNEDQRPLNATELLARLNAEKEFATLRSKLFAEQLIRTFISPVGLASFRSGMGSNDLGSVQMGPGFFANPSKFVVKLRNARFTCGLPAAPSGYGGEASSSELMRDLSRLLEYPVRLDLTTPEARLVFKFEQWNWRLSQVVLPEPATCQLAVEVPGSFWQKAEKLIASRKPAFPPMVQTAPQMVTTPKAVSWTGTWSLDNSLTQLSLTEVNGQVTGSIVPGPGSITARVTGGRLRGTCDIGRNQRVTVDLMLSDDGESYTGSMRSTTGRITSRPWSGHRTSINPLRKP